MAPAPRAATAVAPASAAMDAGASAAVDLRWRLASCCSCVGGGGRGCVGSDGLQWRAAAVAATPASSGGATSEKKSTPRPKFSPAALQWAKKKCLLRASPVVPLKFLPYISKQGTPLKRFSLKNCSTPAVPLNISLILYFKNIS